MADTTDLLPPSLRGTMIGKEKITGSVVGLGIIGALGYGAYLALPIIAAMMTSLFTIVASAVGVTALVLVVTNKGTRSAVKLGYAVLTRKIHNKIIQSAPYDVVNYIIGCMQQRIADGQLRLAKLRGATNRTKAQIEKNEEAIRNRLSLAKAAEKLNQVARKDAQLRMLGQVTDANNRLKVQLDMQQKLTDMMQSGLENAALKVEEQQESVKLAIETNSILADGSAAAADVFAAINGDPEKKALFNDAMDTIARDSAMKLGQIDQMMLDLKPIMNDIELGKLVDAERGQAVLDSFSTTVGQIAQPVERVVPKLAPVVQMRT